MRYGVGYKGSKSRIAEELISVLPSGKRFIDLFGGGGAMTHCAALSGKYKAVVYSDIDSSISSLCKAMFSGEYKDRNDLYEWVSRERFLSEKDSNPIIRWCWSFANNGKDYLYSKDIERHKEAVHKAIVNSEYSDLFLEITSGIIPFKTNTIFSRKQEWAEFCRDVLKDVDGNRDQSIERLLNIQSLTTTEAKTRNEALTHCDALRRITVLNRSYNDYVYEDGDVVYCDIPYKSTNCGSYTGFNHDEFYSWARGLPCYISEYTAPDDFSCIWEKERLCSTSVDIAEIGVG